MKKNVNESCKKEFNALLASLRYEFLNANSSYPVIINAFLNTDGTSELLDDPSKYMKTLDDNVNPPTGLR